MTNYSQFLLDPYQNYWVLDIYFLKILNMSDLSTETEEKTASMTNNHLLYMNPTSKLACFSPNYKDKLLRKTIEVFRNNLVRL